MEGVVRIEEARKLFGRNLIGVEELGKQAHQLGILVPENIPDIPFGRELLEAKATDYLLILGVSTMEDGSSVTLASLRERFGIDPDASEPCFYNQDWYLKEDFMQNGLHDQWYLIRRSVFESSRACSPEKLLDIYHFPSAIQCAFAFFTTWFCLSECLWKNDFIWCSDVDHNLDRIYVGKYNDIDGINKNGFSIHRHLALRNSYASIDSF